MCSLACLTQMVWKIASSSALLLVSDAFLSACGAHAEHAGALMADNARLQEQAAKLGIPKKLLDLLPHILDQGDAGDLSSDLAYRGYEVGVVPTLDTRICSLPQAVLLALASLCMQCDETRILICESDTRPLESINIGLRHRSYGVRAAACQLARALSRSVAIIRTSLYDNDVPNHVLACLMYQISLRKRRCGGDLSSPSTIEFGDRSWTVEVAATATMCNFFTNFSPMREVSHKHAQSTRAHGA